MLPIIVLENFPMLVGGGRADQSLDPKPGVQLMLTLFDPNQGTMSVLVVLSLAQYNLESFRKGVEVISP